MHSKVRIVYSLWCTWIVGQVHKSISYAVFGITFIGVDAVIKYKGLQLKKVELLIFFTLQNNEKMLLCKLETNASDIHGNAWSISAASFIYHISEL